MISRLKAAAFLLAACGIASAAVPTEFRVTADGNAFYPAQPLRKGDRLQVLSPYLIGHDSLFLMRCLDDCRRSEIVRSWNGRVGGTGPAMLESMTIQQDGQYFFVPKTFSLSLQQRNLQACVELLPLHEMCADASAMAIREVKATPELFRVHLQSGSWIWVRRTAAAPAIAEAALPPGAAS